jgi:DNA-binding LytR/AlgR family response regulator
MKLIKTTPSEQTAKRIPIFNPSLPNLKSTKNKAERGYRKIALPTMEGIHFRKIEQIVRLEAKGNYTNIHFINGKKSDWWRFFIVRCFVVR